MHHHSKMLYGKDTKKSLETRRLEVRDSGLTHYIGRVHLRLYGRNREVEGIGKFIRRYFGLSSEETKNSSELSFHSSEVSFHSSEVSFHSSEVLFSGSVENFRFPVSYWGNSS